MSVSPTWTVGFFQGRNHFLFSDFLKFWQIINDQEFFLFLFLGRGTSRGVQWEKAEWDPVWEYPSGLLKARLSYSSGLPWGDKMKKITLYAFKDLIMSVQT